MADVTVERSVLTEEGAHQLPRVCVLSGEPADGTIWFRLSHTPAWTFLLILFGILPFLIAEYFTTERIKVTLPVTRAALARLRRMRRLRTALLLVGVALFVVALVAGSTALLWAGVAMFLAGAVLWVAVSWRMPSWAPADVDAVTLRSVHADFVHAVGTAAGTAG